MEDVRAKQRSFKQTRLQNHLCSNWQGQIINDFHLILEKDLDSQMLKMEHHKLFHAAHIKDGKSKKICLSIQIQAYFNI